MPAVQQNLETYEEPELNGAVKAFCARRDLLAARGIKYLVVFAPEKGTIYPELMPTGWSRRQGPGRLEQLQGLLLQQHIDYVDARSLLIKAKQNEGLNDQLYFSDDSHWNRYGVFLVAQQIFRQLHLEFVNLTPFQSNEVHWQNDDHAGDLAKLLGLQKSIVDRKSLAATTLKKQAHEVDNAGLPRFESGIVETAIEPSAFRTNNLKLPRAFVLHDSFMEFLQPYLAERFSFSEFYLARLLLPEVVLGEKPDVVIDEIAERHLYDRGFENIPTFMTEHSPPVTVQANAIVASFQNQWQLLSVKTKKYQRSLGIELHWRALKHGKLNDRVLLTLLDARTKGVKGVTEYRQDSFACTVKAGQEWSDVVPVTFFSNSKFDQIGIMVVKDSGALWCDAPQCDYKVRVTIDLPASKESPLYQL